jgi:hypothetical protein
MILGTAGSPSQHSTCGPNLISYRSGIVSIQAMFEREFVKFFASRFGIEAVRSRLLTGGLGERQDVARCNHAAIFDFGYEG